MPLTISLGELVLPLLKAIDCVIDRCEKFGFYSHYIHNHWRGFYGWEKEEAQSVASACRANCKEVLQSRNYNW